MKLCMQLLTNIPKDCFSNNMKKNLGRFSLFLNPYGHSYFSTRIYGAHTLSISCTKSVISCKASIFFSHARLQGSIFSPYCDSFWHKLSQYGKKIPYTYVYHIVYCLRKCEALHEITVFVHEMHSVCAPLGGRETNELYRSDH